MNSQMRQAPEQPVAVAYELLADNGKSLTTIGIDSLGVTAKTCRTFRLALGVQAFRNQVVSLQPIFSNLAINRCQWALVHVYENGASGLSRPEVPPTVATDVPLPLFYQLEQNYPNPFNPETKIQYQLPQASHVTLRIYNLLGEVVRTLVDQEQAPGEQVVHWDGKDVQGKDMVSGIYLCRIEAGAFIASRKLALVR